jgi:hypothetical protein
VCPIREIVEHIDEYDDGEEIYVKDVAHLEPETPAAVTNRSLSGEQLEQDLGFRCLGEVMLAREVVDQFGRCKNEDEFRELLDLVEEWCE